MIQVWLYDENRIYIDSMRVEEIASNMTTIPLTIGYVKPTFNEALKEWYEGATKEEIDAWNEANKPRPSEPNQMEVLKNELVTTNQYLTELELLLLEKGVM